MRSTTRPMIALSAAAALLIVSPAGAQQAVTAPGSLRAAVRVSPVETHAPPSLPHPRLPAVRVRGWTEAPPSAPTAPLTRPTAPAAESRWPKPALPTVGQAVRRGAAGAVLGALFGGYIEAFIDPRGEMLDLWPVELAIPGFVGGVVYSFFD